MTTQNKLKVGDKVKYGNEIATVVALCPPACGHAAVVIEYKALFADFGPSWAQIERKSIIEKGLEVVA